MPDKSKKKLFLIDGNSFCYRAYYAIKHLSNSKGQPTNAIYGFMAMLRKIIKDEKPDMIAVAFDLKGPTFRHKEYDGYKIKRKPMPDDLVSQLPYIKKLVSIYNIPIFEKEGYEGDDILATLAEKASSKKIDTFIATGDKDMMQMIGPHVKVYNPQKEGMIYGDKEVKKRFGVSPDKIPDVMGLMGDTSDNIPGVMGIGEKTATELIQKFGSLENLLKNIEKIKSESCKKKIEASKDEAIMSKGLATVKRDVPIEIDLNDLNLKNPNEELLIDFFKELEFKTMLKEFIPTKASEGDYRLIDNKKDFRNLTEILHKTRSFAFDFETTHYDPMKAKPVGISFCVKKGEAFYIPFNALKDISEKEVLQELKKAFENQNIEKVAQNIKYDILILKNLNINVDGRLFDTMIASYLLDPSRSRHNLNDISVEHLGRMKKSINELLGKGKNAVTMDKVDVKNVSDYCCEDSDLVFCLRDILLEKMSKKECLDLFYNVEMPLVRVLIDMEFYGVNIDKEYLNKLSLEMGKVIRKLEKNIHNIAGEEFNINSPKQMQVLLFEKMKMPIVKKTKTGASTDEGVLKVLAEKYELPKEILSYRKLAKLKSTYVDSLPELINSRTGRIHTSFNQAVTATGRLSSSNPNLQNIPIKTEEGKKIRKAFVVGKKDHLMLSADYSQIELRILAHFSGDSNLKEAFMEGKDVHAFTASLVNNVKEKDVTPKMRQDAKTVNFGIIYGLSAYGLSKDLSIDVHDAQKFIDSYFDRYPGVKTYLHETVEEARVKGYVSTIMGRRRYIPDISSSNISARNFAERIAVNAPLQGSAADIIKLAMINIKKSINETTAKMILQVHDELVFEVEKSSVKKIAKKIKSDMENVIKLQVPLEVYIEAGKNWLEAEEVDA